MTDATTTAPAKNGGRYASRKFLLALLVLLGAGAMNVAGIKPDPLLVDLVRWVVGLYMAGNVAAEGVARMVKPT